MKERRKAKRVNVGLRVRWEGENKKSEGRLVDLSVSGCFINTTADVMKGEEVVLEIDLPKEGHIFLCAEVVHRKTDGFAVHFTQADDRDRLALEWLLKAELYRTEKIIPLTTATDTTTNANTTTTANKKTATNTTNANTTTNARDAGNTAAPPARASKATRPATVVPAPASSARIPPSNYAPERCAWCAGAGKEEPTVRCHVCGGKGGVLVEQPPRICPTCRGAGYPPLTARQPCPDCRGGGWQNIWRP